MARPKNDLRSSGNGKVKNRHRPIVLIVMSTVAERTRWDRAARELGVPVSTFARDALDAAALNTPPRRWPK